MLSHVHVPGAPITHSRAGQSCQAVSPALVGAITPFQLEPSKCYLVGVGPGTLDLCTVRMLSHETAAGTKMCINAELTSAVLQMHTPHAHTTHCAATAGQGRATHQLSTGSRV